MTEVWSLHILTVRDSVGVDHLDEIHVIGGNCLKGSITVQGSKNTVLPIMAASLLQREICVLRGCPRILDVCYMEEILHILGVVTWWKGHDLYLDCSKVCGMEIASEYTGRMRCSVILLGALLGRNQRGVIGYPGGCVIGKRPIDLHLYALKSLGAIISEKNGKIQADCKKLKGQEINFPDRSVGATEQALLAAVLAEGETVLRNCAREPEITWLCRFLQKMGARIWHEKEGCIRVQGVTSLHGTEMLIPADRIVTGTYLCAAAASRGSVTVENAPEGEMEAFLEVYRKMGGQYEGKSGTLRINGERVCSPVPLVETGIYPGFPTDLQAPLMAVLAGIQGVSRIREKIFDDRFGSALQMRKMGAHIEITGNTAVICGTDTLKGCTTEAGDLRGGAALIIAALGAKGETCIRGTEFISRGYEHICEDLEALGCRIWQSSGKGNERI